MDNKLKVLIGAAVAVALFFAFRGGVNLGGISPGITATNSSSTVGIVVKQIFSYSSGAQYRSISNPGPSPIYISKTATSTGFVAGVGQIIYASTTYEMTESAGNLWVGNVWGITATATSVITTSEL